jgi:hypothetical protein
MELDKDTIVSFIKGHMGDEGKAQQAEAELPDKINTDKDAGLLDRFGVDPGELMSRLKDLPAISGLLGDND